MYNGNNLADITHKTPLSVEENTPVKVQKSNNNTGCSVYFNCRFSTNHNKDRYYHNSIYIYKKILLTKILGKKNTLNTLNTTLTACVTNELIYNLFNPLV